MLTSKELATVLAALRYWQQELDQQAEDDGPIDEEHFKEETPLTVKEIDELCERINVKDIRPDILDALVKMLEWLGRLEDHIGPKLLMDCMPNNFGRQMARDLIKKLGGLALNEPAYKAFKVASVSSNYNSFGLRGMILVAKDCESWQVAANDLNLKKKGEIINVPMDRDTKRPMFEHFTFETPERLKIDAPSNVVAEIWKEEACPKKKSSSSSERTERQPSRSSARRATVTPSRSRLKKGGK